MYLAVGRVFTITKVLSPLLPPFRYPGVVTRLDVSSSARYLSDFRSGSQRVYNPYLSKTQCLHVGPLSHPPHLLPNLKKRTYTNGPTDRYSGTIVPKE